MDRYENRRAAGKVLANSLKSYANRNDVIVLGLPRGGVPVAFEVAKALRAPLDVFIVRKLGMPGQPELALGAIAMGDVIIFNDEILHSAEVNSEKLLTIITAEKKELQRRMFRYRESTLFPDLKSKKVILVDDGIATGASMRAAIEALRQLNAAWITVAVPVASRDSIELMATLANECICPLMPESFGAVGEWYQDFTQTEDGEVVSLLEEARQ